MVKTAVLVSGGGTNLQALIDASARGEMPGVELALVVSNNSGAYALERAKAAGIRAEYLEKSGFEDRLGALLDEEGVGLVILAGFLRILSEEFTRRWAGRIINIHPSLIPSFCGVGCYGLHVHEKALEYGVKISGATVHFVTEECDAGPIILQKAAEVLPGDTPEVLQRRIMEQCEWKLLPQAVSLFCQDRLKVEGRAVRILDCL